MSKPRVLVPVATGSEDMETSVITDVLVRCGIDVVVASCDPSGSRTVTMARGLRLEATRHIADITAAEADGIHAVVYPGGMPGARTLGECAPLTEITRVLVARGALLGAICAAPVKALGPNGFLAGVHEATCFPALRGEMPSGTRWVPHRVVVSPGAHGPVITSQGPATALPFALVVAAALVGPEVVHPVASALLINDADAALLQSKF